MKWIELFDYLANTLYGGIKDIQMSGYCCDDLRYTEGFCEKHNLDFLKIKEILEETGGFCDCEVLLNSAFGINEEDKIPSVSEAE